MAIRSAATIAAVNLLCGLAWAQGPRVVTLDEAFTRTLEKHPALARYGYLHDAALALVDADSQHPPLRLDLEVENAPRSGQAASFDSAEATLSLASVFERGGKLAARRAVAAANLDALALRQEQERADVLAEVARRYLDVLTAQSLADLATLDVAQRETAVRVANQRVRAGATPDSVRLAAEAAFTRAGIQRDRNRIQIEASMRSLAILWGHRELDFDRVTGDPLALPSVPSLDDLRTLLERNPELRQFADATRVREARVQLARSARATDIDWRAGVRRLEEDGSWAAVVGVSVPLGSASRAAPGIRAAQAELAALSLEREAQVLTLESTLVDAHLRLTGASAEVVALRDLLLPKLDLAERAAERAFRAGALSYIEWSQVQTEVMAARREQLLTAIEARRALIEIQRLTGNPFIAENTRTQP